MQAIINAKLVCGKQELTGYALIFDNRIRAICPLKELADWPVAEIFDATGCIVTPGFIDIHVHGCGGYDTMDASLAGLQAMASCLANYGVTSFLPTLMAAEWEAMQQALSVVREMMELASSASTLPQTANPTGAKVLGAHLEGPFLNPKYKGAQVSSAFRQPDFTLLDDYLDVLRIITLAPELGGSDDLLSKLAEHSQIVPAIGHSGANYEQALHAIKSGVRHATHLFNAMEPLHHRHPGVVGAVLTTGLSAELIADNLHVHPSLYSLVLKTQGPEQLILVSDAMRATGLPAGKSELGGQLVHVGEDGAARLANGTLAGSVLTLNRAVANFKEASNCSLATAVGLATRNPARLLGLENEIGDLAVGKQADILVLDPHFNLVSTYINGQITKKEV